MFFASKYVLAAKNEEEVDEELLEAAEQVGLSNIATPMLSAQAAEGKNQQQSVGGGGSLFGLFGSSSDSGGSSGFSFSFGSSAPAAPAAATAPPLRRAGRRVRRQVDTNVVSVRFDTLAQTADDVFAGDPVFCRECKAALSHLSKVIDAKDAPAPAAGASDEEKKAAQVQLEEGQRLWICEFCGCHNAVDIVDEEIPTSTTRDYVIVGAPSDGKEAEKKGDAEDDSILVFAIDVSGSMCVTTEVPGTFKLKNTRDDSAVFGQFYDQPPVQRRNVTYVSRLQAVQAAVEKQLEDLARAFPKRRVVLVTFNNEVTIVGDGTSPVEVIAGDKLHNQEQLIAAGSKYGAELKTPISASKEELTKKLFALEEGGATALGPAMVVSLAIAANKPGSTVIVCTDGLANVGLGALDVKTDEEAERVIKWYENIAAYAKEKGVTASVISIKGDECSLENLGKVAAATGGDVDRVDPLELTKNFSSILANPVIATGVQLTFLLHKGLQFRNEGDIGNKLVRDIGNVTKETELLFEFGVREDVLARFPDLKQLPFQVQITFTALNGMRALRVISEAQPITKNREEAEREVRLDLLQANVAQQSAKLASQGAYRDARVNNMANIAYVGRLAAQARQDYFASPEAQAAMATWLRDMERLDRTAAQAEREQAGYSPFSFFASAAPVTAAAAPVSYLFSSGGGSSSSSSGSSGFSFVFAPPAPAPAQQQSPSIGFVDASGPAPSGSSAFSFGSAAGRSNLQSRLPGTTPVSRTRDEAYTVFHQMSRRSAATYSTPAVPPRRDANNPPAAPKKGS